MITAFDIDEEVFILNNNKIIKDKICKITIFTTLKQEYLLESGNTKMPDYIFRTEQELLDALLKDFNKTQQKTDK